MKLATFTIEGLQNLDPDSKEYWVQRCKFAEQQVQELLKQLHSIRNEISWAKDTTKWGV
jgi:hypothetical protein